MDLCGGMQLILTDAFGECDLLERISIPCRALVITGNGEGQNFSLVKDGFTPQVSHRKLVIASECFNSICSAEMSGMEAAIMRILGEAIMRSKRPWYEESRYSEWDEKCQRLRVLLAPHEERHKKDIASVLELRGVGMVQEHVLSFLHFL